MTRAPFLLSSSLFFSVLPHGICDSSRTQALIFFPVLAVFPVPDARHGPAPAFFRRLAPALVFFLGQVPVCGSRDTLLSGISHNLHRFRKQHFHLSQGETTYPFS